MQVVGVYALYFKSQMQGTGCFHLFDFLLFIQFFHCCGELMESRKTVLDTKQVLDACMALNTGLHSFEKVSVSIVL